MDQKGILSLNEGSIYRLFGALGTHSHCAGSVLWLQDKFFSDKMGRKIVVLAPSRAAAARAIKSVLFETYNGYSVSQKSMWCYEDNKNQGHGPFGYERMAKWYSGGYFGDGSMPIRLQTESDSKHDATAWVPVWILEFLEAEAGIMYEDEVDDMDWEMTVRNISDLRIRDQVGLKSDLLKLEFPLSELEAVKPMDYDAIPQPLSLDIHNMHIVAILDTNVLLSHFSLLERTFQELLATECDSTQECNVFELMALVPWVVLNELDHFKSLENHQGSSARYALKRIKILATKRDSFLHLQNGTQHQQVVDRITLPAQKQSLRNDDFILQTCISFSRGLVMNKEGLKPFVLLISNDQGLQVRATANGIACIRAVDFAVSRRKLTQTLLDLEEKLGQVRQHAEKLGTNHEMISGHQQIFDREKKNEQVGLPTIEHEPALIERMISPREQYEAIQSIIVDSLGTFVMYIRQQDLGELWEELLEDELKPPWDAHQVLRVIIRHNTPFWDVFDRHAMGQINVLLRSLKKATFDVFREQCLQILIHLLKLSNDAFGKCLTDTAPDPALIEGFVSLGDAKQAVEYGMRKLSTFQR
eukprot:jgi/Picsp_1/2026/NSC_05492-R1_pinc domain-containing protein